MSSIENESIILENNILENNISENISLSNPKSDSCTEKSLQQEYYYDRKVSKKEYYKGKVILFHGPYEAFNFIRHRPEKLRTIKGLIENEGYLVEYVGWGHFNRMGIEVNQKLIFTSRMTDLDFDGFNQNQIAKQAYKVTMNFLKRIEAWYLLKYFGKRTPYEYFSLSFGH